MKSHEFAANKTEAGIASKNRGRKQQKNRGKSFGKASEKLRIERR